MAIPWLAYLATLSPTIGYKDSPEFVDTVFTLGISHPAGFPTYNLLGKWMTFIPLGSIAFRVNLFSAFFACLALGCLYGASRRLLALFNEEETPSDGVVPALLTAGLLAFSAPFWLHALVAEVYTLHAFFICLVIVLLLEWKLKEDVRFLYAAALVFGLSAGNHATVAFFLPAILVLFFCWNRQAATRHLGVSTVFFLVGLSVYLYLPIRSLAEPSFDWGNPETWKGFLYQVTDRKDADTHFAGFRAGAEPGAPAGLDSAWTGVLLWFQKMLQAVKALIVDLNTHFSPVVILGLLTGGFLCFKKSLPLFLFFTILLGSNAFFFYGWGAESYFPSYIVALLLTSLFLDRLLYRWIPAAQARMGSAENGISTSLKGGLSQIGWKKIVVTVLVCLIPWTAARNFYQVDRSRSYFPETFLKRVFLTLDNNSIFVPGISWFNFHYHNDVMRLRDDVIPVPAWDLLSGDPPSILTRKRYPGLSLPEPSRHRFDSREGGLAYAEDLFERNYPERPILIEQNQTLFEQLGLSDRLDLGRNLLLKYHPKGKEWTGNKEAARGFETFRGFVEDELKKRGIQLETAWINKIAFYIPSFAMYYHDTGRYAEERTVLEVLNKFLGQRGVDWRFQMVDNLILDHQREEARVRWTTMKRFFPDHFKTWLAKGLLLRSEGDTAGSIQAFRKAQELQPDHFRPHLEAARSYLLIGDTQRAGQARAQAEQAAKNLREMKLVRRMETLPDGKEGRGRPRDSKSGRPSPGMA